MYRRDLTRRLILLFAFCHACLAVDPQEPVTNQLSADLIANEIAPKDFQVFMALSQTSKYIHDYLHVAHSSMRSLLKEAKNLRRSTGDNLELALIHAAGQCRADVVAVFAQLFPKSILGFLNRALLHAALSGCADDAPLILSISEPKSLDMRADTLRYLMTLGADPLYRDPVTGLNILRASALFNHEKTVKFLLAVTEKLQPDKLMLIQRMKLSHLNEPAVYRRAQLCPHIHPSYIAQEPFIIAQLKNVICMKYILAVDRVPLRSIQSSASLEIIWLQLTHGVPGTRFLLQQAMIADDVDLYKMAINWIRFSPEQLASHVSTAFGYQATNILTYLELRGNLPPMMKPALFNFLI